MKIRYSDAVAEALGNAPNAVKNYITELIPHPKK